MHPDLMAAIEHLEKNGQTLVAVRQGAVVFESGKPGVTALIETLAEQPEKIQGSYVADKIIGAAAALLLIHGNAASVYAQTISDLGIQKFRENGNKIEIYFGRTVEKILNRTKNGICPLEEICSNYIEPRQAYETLHKKITGGQTK